MRLNYPEVLPIAAHRREIVDAIVKNQVVIVVGETGSGKSTQIPKMILEAFAEIHKTDPSLGDFKIACTQPRRLAAVSIATWMAQEMGVILGEEVGYKIRFEDESTKGTKITICTDGILLQEMKGDGLLSRYDAVLVDEAHERNLNIDFLLGLLKDIQGRRKAADLAPLKMLITSATFDADKFAQFFQDLNSVIDGEVKPVPIINVSGRMYPVEVRYAGLEKGEDLFVKTAELVHGIVHSDGGGDILIFMPGEAEIFQTIREIEWRDKRGVKCLPLYSRLSMEDQELVYADYPGMIKVIVSTNIAETSLTVPGITHVLDSGLARMTDFNFKTGIGSLETRPVSQASAIQRAGRAGRIAPGVCVRLFTEEDFLSREKYTKPEIQRSDLSSVVLHMLLIGIEDLMGFSFIDVPEARAYRNAIANLIELGAIDEQKKLTPLGVKMAHLPLEPRISAMLLAAEKYQCVREVAVIASSLSVKDPFLRPKEEEAEADRAKKHFQRMALGELVRYKTVRVRKGRRVFIRKVKDTSVGPRHPASDLIVFLVVWNKLQEFNSDAEREAFCQAHYLNWLMFQEIAKIFFQLLDTLNVFAKDEFSKYLFTEDNPDLSADLSKRDGILKAISTGFIQNLCEANGPQIYKSRSADNILIHPGSALFPLHPQFFVAAEIVETTRLFARNNTMVDPAWFVEIAPQLCRIKYGPIKFDMRSGQAVRPRDVFFRDKRVGCETLVPVAVDDVSLAVDYLIQEGLINKMLGVKRFPWLEDNAWVVSQLKFYAAKLRRPELAIHAAKLKDWYRAKLGVSPRPVVSGDDVEVLLQTHGADYLKLNWKECLSVDDLKQIQLTFPESVYLAGVSRPVHYIHDHSYLEDGAYVMLRVADLFDLDDVVVAKELSKYNALRVNFLITDSDSVESCASNDVIACGESVVGVKQDVDNWHLRKALKKLHRLWNVKNIRWAEIWHYWEKMLLPVEVGVGLFGQGGVGDKKMVYVGLAVEGKKLARGLFDSPELAWKAGLNVLKEYFLYLNRQIMNFSETDIIELEAKYEKFFYGMDFPAALRTALWKRIDFDGKLSDLDVFKNVSFVRGVLDQEALLLSSYKSDVLEKIMSKLKQMQLLAESNAASQVEKLMREKRDLNDGNF